MNNDSQKIVLKKNDSLLPSEVGVFWEEAIEKLQWEYPAL